MRVQKAQQEEWEDETISFNRGIL